MTHTSSKARRSSDEVRSTFGRIDAALVGPILACACEEVGPNVFGVNAHTGRLAWQHSIPDKAASRPKNVGMQLAVEGYDPTTRQDRRLYLLNAGTGATIEEVTAREGGAGDRGGPRGDGPQQFAVAPDASWKAASGDLGTDVWNFAGAPLWSIDRFLDDRGLVDGGRAGAQGIQQPHLLAAAGKYRLVVAANDWIAAYEAFSGVRAWHVPIAGESELRQVVASQSGETVAARFEAGRIVVIFRGKLANADLAVPDLRDLALSPNGRWLVAAAGDELQLHSVAAGVSWTREGASSILHPTFSPRGDRIVATTAGGEVVIVTLDGHVHRLRHKGRIAKALWHPAGDLFTIGNGGEVALTEATGRERWRLPLGSGGRALPSNRPQSTRPGPGPREFWGFSVAVKRRRPPCRSTYDFAGLLIRSGPKRYPPSLPTAVSFCGIQERVVACRPNPIVVDVGTGSGALAFATANLRPDATVYATDVIRRSLRDVRRTARALGLNVRALHGSILDPVRGKGLEGGVSMIIGHLPVVPPHLMRRSVLARPVQLLGGDADGLGLNRQLARDAREFLAPGGTLAIGSFGFQHAALVRMLHELGYKCPDLGDAPFDSPRIQGNWFIWPG
jgi:hypothetical protein